MLVPGMILLAIFYLLIYWITQTPSNALPEQAPLDAFSAGRALNELKNLINETQAHPVDSQANNLVKNKLVSRLKELGLKPEVQRQKTCNALGDAVACITTENILALLPGTQKEPVIVLSAHYDSVASGPGISDDGISVASVLEIVRILKRQGPFRNTLLIVFSDGEEFGQRGAHAFLAHHPMASHIATVINMEARGTKGMSAMFETGEDNRWLIERMSVSIRRPVANSMLYKIYEHMPNRTDLTAYKEYGIGGLNFAFGEGFIHYHTPQDIIENLSQDTVQHHGENVFSITKALLASQLDTRVRGEVSYLDIATWKIIYWPQELSLYFALLGMSLVAIATVILWCKQEISLFNLGWSMVSWFAFGAIAMLGGAGIHLIVRGLVVSERSLFALSGAAELAIWLMVAFAVIVTGNVFSKKVNAYSLIIAVWIIQAGLSLLTALFFKGSEIVFIFPLLGSSVLLIIFAYLDHGVDKVSGQTLIILQVMVLALTWFPVSIAATIMLGISWGIAISIPGVIIFSAFLPLSVIKNNQPGKALLLLSVAIVLAVLDGALSKGVLPTVNIIHMSDFDQGKNSWLIYTRLTSLPKAIVEELNFLQENNGTNPWSKGASFLDVEAPSHQASPPKLELLGSDMLHGKKKLTLRYQSPRNAYAFALHVPEIAKLSAIDVEGVEISKLSTKSIAGYHRFSCFGQACNGQVFTLVLESEEKEEYVLEEIGVGLPKFAEKLIKARNVVSTQAGPGDLTKVLKRFTF